MDIQSLLVSKGNDKNLSMKPVRSLIVLSFPYPIDYNRMLAYPFEDLREMEVIECS
jgi:hypothetical protein